MSPPGPSSPGSVFFCGVPVGGTADTSSSSRRDCGCTTTTGGVDSHFDGTTVDGFAVVAAVTVGVVVGGGGVTLPKEFDCGTDDDDDAGILNEMTGGGLARIVSVPETETADVEQGDTTCMFSSGSSSLVRERSSKLRFHLGVTSAVLAAAVVVTTRGTFRRMTRPDAACFFFHELFTHASKSRDFSLLPQTKRCIALDPTLSLPLSLSLSLTSASRIFPRAHKPRLFSLTFTSDFFFFFFFVDVYP